MLRRLIIFAGFVLGTAAVSAPQAAQAPKRAPELQALASLQPGLWQLKQSGSGAADKTICLGDIKQLIQVRHPNNACVRHVIADEPRQSRVYYTCAGAGHAQTTVQVETPRLAQISSQGIVDREPFAVNLEARRIGVCAPGGGGGRGR